MVSSLFQLRSNSLLKKLNHRLNNFVRDLDGICTSCIRRLVCRWCDVFVVDLEVVQMMMVARLEQEKHRHIPAVLLVNSIAACSLSKTKVRTMSGEVLSS